MVAILIGPGSERVGVLLESGEQLGHGSNFLLFFHPESSRFARFRAFGDEARCQGACLSTNTRPLLALEKSASAEGMQTSRLQGKWLVSSRR
jgi:type II secretory pathway component PulM